MMTKTERKEAIDYINGQLEYGYIDLGAHDNNELEIIKEAIQLLKIIDGFNNIPEVLDINKNKEEKEE